MISTKKSYAEQLLQFVLALSLLRTDPENYLDWGWETRLAGTGVGGWQLEMRAAPLNDYVYANRKTVIPLIEDLARYDRYENYNDVQAYLLNVQSSDPQPQTNNTEQNITNHLHHLHEPTEVVVPERAIFLPNYETDDQFLNSDPFDDSTVSIFEQNIADLNENQEIPNILNYPFQSMPLKDDVPDLNGIPMFDINRDLTEDTANYNVDYGELNGPASPENLGGIIHWNEYFELKDEERNGTETIYNNTITVVAHNATESDLKIKKENTTTSVIITAELTQEVSTL
jgi:hypothetical protein